MFSHPAQVGAGADHGGGRQRQQVSRTGQRRRLPCNVSSVFCRPPAICQVALLGLQFQWTADTQAALVSAKTDKTAMAKALRKARHRLHWLCTQGRASV